jgi:hypothetical protein
MLIYVPDLFDGRGAKAPKAPSPPIESTTDACMVCMVRVMARVIVFNATFNNISAISWWSVLLVEETGVPAENHRSVVSH